jgi:hypothetical protein
VCERDMDVSSDFNSFFILHNLYHQQQFPLRKVSIEEFSFIVVPNKTGLPNNLLPYKSSSLFWSN